MRVFRGPQASQHGASRGQRDFVGKKQEFLGLSQKTVNPQPVPLEEASLAGSPGFPDCVLGMAWAAGELLRGAGQGLRGPDCVGQENQAVTGKVTIKSFQFPFN